MKLHVISLLLLIFTVESESSADESFFISAPTVFHVGVNEKVFIQLGKQHLNVPFTLYMEHEITNVLASERKSVVCTDESQGKTVELMINRDVFSQFKYINTPPYLNLVAESRTLPGRHVTRVLVSNHRGYIFIQTDQPMYNLNQKVKYRIFTLDHTLRPHEETFQLSIINANGNRIMKSLKTAKWGLFSEAFDIPDVSKMGTWKITAHYIGDEANAASREFKVQKFVLPSFEVNIAMEHKNVLLSANEFFFTISAMYSRGDNVIGAYHCQFAVADKKTTTKTIIRGLERVGSINGSADVNISIAEIKEKLTTQTLSDLQRKGAQLYLGVFVTDTQSGEMQQDEVYLSVITHKYTMDLSRTRSYFVPGFPLDVVVVMRLPNGSPAANVPVNVQLPALSDKSWSGITDQHGTVSTVFNINNLPSVTVKVTADDIEQSKEIKSMSSPGNSYLYLSITNRVYSVNELLSITYNTKNAPNSGFIYYMVLSRGILVKHGSFQMGLSVKDNLMITPELVPSFRLIGYYYNQQGHVIADSVWIDVRDECEIKVEVKPEGKFEPGNIGKLGIDLGRERAKVALLAVDKAFYGLHADNKLTGKQVFSTMQSYDLGCSYGGGVNPSSVLVDAGLSFLTQAEAHSRNNFGCGSQSTRQRRSVDIQQEMTNLKSNFSDETIQECCVHGFSLIPMSLSCQERAERVSLVKKNQACTDAFLKCCLEGERLRKEKIKEDALKGLGRTASRAEIEEFFLNDKSNIRHYFPPSFYFYVIDVNGRASIPLPVPDSITTWEIQAITVSPKTGFCVVNPYEVQATKEVFISLTLPYSVKKYEQIAISPIIYNYKTDPLHLAVHMEQTKGLCSPGSASSKDFVNITVKASSSQLVTFSAVPMVTGLIPIKIRLYDIENELRLDGIEKKLNVKTEGLEKRDEETRVIKLDGRSTNNFTYDASLPDDTVPDSGSSIFISMEGNGFTKSYAKNLLSPEDVAKLVTLPTGCLEQTMVRLAPTTFALRYLDQSGQWFGLPAGARDDALDKIERGYMRVLTFKKDDDSYGLYGKTKLNNWVTALVVKVLSMVAEMQTVAVGVQGRNARVVPEEEIRKPVKYLLSVQKNDGSYPDDEMVLHRGILKGRDEEASLTAFITLALHRSLQFLQDEERRETEARISRSTKYLLSHFKDLQHPYAVAITAYCLTFCMPKGTNHDTVWAKLEAMAIQDKNDCYLWSTNEEAKNEKRADAITVETSAYVLLTAIVLEKTEWATRTACWLSTQENYKSGYIATQDTIMALQALSEYELFRSTSPEANVIAEFTVPGKKDILSLALQSKTERVETDLKKLLGETIHVQLTGSGETKIKIVKAYYLRNSNDDCHKLSIRVKVEGKVKYTAKILKNYDEYEEYEDYGDTPKDTRVSRSADEWSDAYTRNRRDVDNEINSEDVIYTVCVSHSRNYQLTGMAIADITLLSGFEAAIEDLERLKMSAEAYISHYEVSYGRVLMYFNTLLKQEECVTFSAKQRVPIDLLQPVPAVFYDYYEPNTKCTRFYSAPKRSRTISRLCSEDVCECAERPCHKEKKTFKQGNKQGLTKEDRVEHACFSPTVDYAYIIEVVAVNAENFFDLYKAKVIDVLRSHGDVTVTQNSVRVFAKRRHCKKSLDLEKQYLIMGKDGSTRDSNGAMQYLLESNTWVEQMPSDEQCEKSGNRAACRGFNTFVKEYKLDGCRQ